MRPTCRPITVSLLVALYLFCTACGSAMAQAGDPLPSWNDGLVKQKILRFVTAAVTPGEGFVKEQDRVATFDNDGTLWCEQPTVEAEFAKSRLAQKAKTDAALRAKIARVSTALKSGKTADIQKDIVDLLGAAYAGMTEEQFADAVRVWLSRARHPKLNRPYTELRYQPMMELLTYLRANKFQTFICSGGTLEFMRVFVPALYRVPPQNIIGSSVNLETRYASDGSATVYRKAGIARINDKEGKPVGIALHIGKRPAFVGGNERSGGDIAMMRYSKGFYGPSLQLLVNHDDAVREFAYAEKDNFSLSAAAKYGFTVVSIKRDWKTVFAPMVSPTDAASSAPATAAALEGVDWRLSEVAGKPLPASVTGTPGAFPFLRFTSEGKRVAGYTAVNLLSGTYQSDPATQKLTFGPLATTRRAGPPEAMTTEAAFQKALTATASYRIAGATLELRDGGGSVAARLTAASAGGAK